MTEETKEILGAIKDLYSVLNNKIDNMSIELTEVKNSMSSNFNEVHAQLQTENNRLTKIETVLENETNKNINLLAEGLRLRKMLCK